MITIPTTTELYNSILADLQATYGSSIPTFGKNFLRATAAVQAAKLKLYYLAIGKLQKNIFVDTADSESNGGTLERFGRIKLNRNPNPATAGQYDVTVTGTIGATIKASTTFKSDDDASNPSKLFVLDVEYVLVSSPDTITIRALESGLDSKLSISDTLTATAPIANVDSIVTVSAEVIEPLSAETLEDYRQVAIEAYRLEPQGGAASDYKLWAADAQGVLYAYPYANSGESNVIDLYIEATIADSIDGKGTPSAGLLVTVEEVVEFDPDVTRPLSERGRRPLGVFDINFLPVVVQDVVININSYVGITATKQTQIENALDLLISGIRPFISGADVLADKNDVLDSNKIISEVLKAVPGSIFDSIDFTVGGLPFSSYTFDNGNIPYLDSVNFV